MQAASPATPSVTTMAANTPGSVGFTSKNTTASGRAMASRATEGFVKCLIDAGTEEVLGLRIVGEHASELIAEGTLAVELASVVEDVATTIHTHPTLAESVVEAVRAAKGEAIHVVNRRR